MTDDARSPLETLLDVVVFAPIGAALHGPQAVEELAAKGRQDVANARFIGKVALDKGRREAVRLSADLQERVNEVVVAAARAAGAPMAGAPAEPDHPAPTDAEAGPVDSGKPATAAHPGGHLSVVPDTTPSAAELAIPDYDNLAASQVVPRLDDLAEDELRAVQEYERAHRGRMTILSRIAQLQAS